jgi:phospholipid/cholesterol/gamma-HCH transport system permease protein
MLAPLNTFITNVGRRTVNGVEEIGYVTALFVEALFWLVAGHWHQQRVRLESVFQEAMLIGVQAVPIVAILTFSVGVMLTIQSIETLKIFGAESKVVIGITLAVTREFSPLIVGILVAGRSGSAIAARIGTMQESQEIDALRVIGINPVRYLVSPVLLAMLIIVPVLTLLGDFMGILGGGIYVALELQMSLDIYLSRTLEVLTVVDLYQGLIKSVVFAIIISLVGVSNGFQARGGAEGVGLSTTRSVVLAISFIVLADMIFTYFLNH